MFHLFLFTVVVAILSGCGTSASQHSVRSNEVQVTNRSTSPVPAPARPSALVTGRDWQGMRENLRQFLSSLSDRQSISNVDDVVWIRCPLGMGVRSDVCSGIPERLTWVGAVERILALNASKYRGFSDWRMPSKAEYLSFVRSAGLGVEFNCPNAQFVIPRVFPLGRSPDMFGWNVWLADSPGSGVRPETADLEVASCHFGLTFPLEAHGARPIILVRGGSQSLVWADAVKKLPNSEKILADARAINAAETGAVLAAKRDVERVVEDMRNASSSSLQGSSASVPSQKAADSIVRSIKSRSYENAGRKTAAFDVSCGNGASKLIYRSAWDNAGDWYMPGFPNGYFVAKSQVAVEQVAQQICRYR